MTVQYNIFLLSMVNLMEITIIGDKIKFVGDYCDTPLLPFFSCGVGTNLL